MNARRIGWAIGVGTLVYSGAYVFVYLYRWEWNRALTAGLFFLAAEIGLVGAFVVERIRKLEHRLDQQAPPAATEPTLTQVRTRLAESAGPGRDHFAWMRSSVQRPNVFIPVLMGAGVILSGIAWVVERLARLTARPALEDKLAVRLLPITLPPGPIVADTHTVPQDLALLMRPGEAGTR